MAGGRLNLARVPKRESTSLKPGNILNLMLRNEWYIEGNLGMKNRSDTVGEPYCLGLGSWVKLRGMMWMSQ